MSIELTEAHILAGQMNGEIVGKTINSYQIQNVGQLQNKGFISKNAVLDQIVGSKILSVKSRGNTILVKLSNGWNLVLAPEYGGIIQLHTPQTELPKFHLKLDLQDTVLTVTLTGIGCIQAVEDALLKTNYLYRRDFSNILNPLESDFKFERFKEKLDEKKQNIKAALVGKTAVIVGVSNSAFQDIIYRAKINPKRNTGTLTEDEKKAVYSAIVDLVVDRLEAGGKDQFVDLHGKPGTYTPKMGSHLKEQNCPECGSRIEKISHGGGQVFLCPTCQK
ncbi:MAG: DNA-formamidopyrimidine glycosylase family protein [Candidatus Bathyarchaeia archaeon]|jgi:formamidopyrimidine-DNA glycosylase